MVIEPGPEVVRPGPHQFLLLLPVSSFLAIAETQTLPAPFVSY